jgi:hypothetical protein
MYFNVRTGFRASEKPSSSFAKDGAERYFIFHLELNTISNNNTKL